MPHIQERRTDNSVTWRWVDCHVQLVTRAAKTVSYWGVRLPSTITGQDWLPRQMPPLSSTPSIERQVQDLANLFRNWSAWEDVKSMMLFGSWTHPRIPQMYVRALALVVKGWFRPTREAAEDTSDLPIPWKPQLHVLRDLYTLSHPYDGAIPAIPFTVKVDEVFLTRLSALITSLCMASLDRSVGTMMEEHFPQSPILPEPMVWIIAQAIKEHIAKLLANLLPRPSETLSAPLEENMTPVDTNSTETGVGDTGTRSPPMGKATQDLMDAAMESPPYDSEKAEDQDPHPSHYPVGHTHGDPVQELQELLAADPPAGF